MDWKRLNELGGELAELRIKYENVQRELEESRGQSRELKTQLEDAKRQAARKEPVQGEGSTLQAQRIVELEEKASALQASSQALTEELEGVRASLAASAQERQSSEEKLAELQAKYQQLKTAAAGYERELREAQANARSMQAALQDKSRQLEAAEKQQARMEEQARRFEAVLAEKEEAEAQTARMRTLTERLLVSSGRQQNELHAQLQTTRELLEQLKLEYERFAEEARVEAEASRRQHQRDYQRLREEYEEFKARAVKASHELQSEHREVVQALQQQFQEYRATAEHLFVTEARQLEARLRHQTAKYESEIVRIVRVKGEELAQLVAAKDAKIMNLIDGTDMQKVVMRHEFELEQIKKQHDRELLLAKEAAHAEQRETVQELQQTISRHVQEAERLSNQVAAWQLKWRDATAALERQREQFTQKEEAQARQAEEVQTQLTRAYEEIERVTQAKEALRHRLLRVTLQLNGKADESLDSTARRLSLEAQRLAGSLEALTAKYQAQLRENAALTSRLDKQTTAAERSRAEAAALRKELAGLADALSRRRALRPDETLLTNARSNTTRLTPLHNATQQQQQLLPLGLGDSDSPRARGNDLATRSLRALVVELGSGAGDAAELVSGIERSFAQLARFRELSSQLGRVSRAGGAAAPLAFPSDLVQEIALAEAKRAPSEHKDARASPSGRGSGAARSSRLSQGAASRCSTESQQRRSPRDARTSIEELSITIEGVQEAGHEAAPVGPRLPETREGDDEGHAEEAQSPKERPQEATEPLEEEAAPSRE